MKTESCYRWFWEGNWKTAATAFSSFSLGQWRGRKRQKTSPYIVWLPYCIDCVWKWKEGKALAFICIMCLKGGERLVSHLVLPWKLQAVLLCNSWADSAKALEVMLLSHNSILCLGMARRSNLCIRTLSCRVKHWPTKFSLSASLIQMVTRDADLSLPAEWLYLTHRMDVFDFDGDLVWRSDLTAEHTSDFSINRQYLLGLWMSGHSFIQKSYSKRTYPECADLSQKIQPSPAVCWCLGVV